jgi:putative chitinase
MDTQAPAAGSGVAALPDPPRSTFTAAQIAAAVNKPLSNVAIHWPLICAALDDHAILSPACEIAAAATMAVETPSFAPIKERGGPAYFVRLYWTNQAQAKELGNLSPADAINFCGRGDVQITGRANYMHYGKALSLDLVNHPELALDPAPAARILALFFRERGIPLAAASNNWERVRRRVNGGLNGWADFSKYVAALSALLAGGVAR